MAHQQTPASDVVRQILPNAADFKTFWKDKGPFAYALTSEAFPPILLEEEEWIFGNDLRAVLKSLMGFKENKMAFVQAPFNAENKGVLRPENLIPWKINHFPEDWNILACDAYVPEGYLTRAVSAEAGCNVLEDLDGAAVEAAFFSLLEKGLEQMGYRLLAPRGKTRNAVIRDYVEEWEEDERDAGIL